MLWVIRCIAKPNIDNVRRAQSKAHTEYLDAKLREGKLILSGGAVDLDGTTVIGSCYIVNYKTSDEARAFLDAEPWAKAGVFDGVTITGVLKSRWNPEAAASAEGRGQSLA